MFKFTEDCILGIPEIDDEHRRLFELIEQGMVLSESGDAGENDQRIKALLEELDHYTQQHFAHEEAYMEQIRDPELIVQRSQHRMFCEKVQEWFFNYLNGLEEGGNVLRDIMEYLSKWLYHHIIGSDLLIGKMSPLEEWMMKENPCEFSDEYRTGIEFVDQQHQELFRITDQAYQCLRGTFSEEDAEKIVRILRELRDYTQRHFGEEEAYMERIHYEGLAQQKRAHESFISKISHIEVVTIEGDPKEYLENLIEFLLGWLINHILYTDKKIPLET